jgi:ferredoxin
MKRAVGSGCVDCGKCVQDCKMEAIPANPRFTRSTECIECFGCVEVCPTDAVSFCLRPKPEFHEETKLDLSRRRVLQGAGVGLALAAMVKIDPARKLATGGSSPVMLSSPALIRPPGSVTEDEFARRCVRCGMCMKACPTNGLQPAIHEAGIEGFWTPILVPRIGYCVEHCNACGNVCATNAIEPFRIEDKKSIFIGTAGIDRSQCIAWNSDRQCLVCDEHCSYKAIEWQIVDGVKRPSVNEEKCVGCGICEYACPIQPVAAIRVYSRGDRRGFTSGTAQG